jgi:hypothetical protein
MGACGLEVSEWMMEVTLGLELGVFTKVYIYFAGVAAFLGVSAFDFALPMLRSLVGFGGDGFLSMIDFAVGLSALESWARPLTNRVVVLRKMLADMCIAISSADFTGLFYCFLGAIIGG